MMEGSSVNGGVARSRAVMDRRQSQWCVCNSLDGTAPDIIRGRDQPFHERMPTSRRAGEVVGRLISIQGCLTTIELSPNGKAATPGEWLLQGYVDWLCYPTQRHLDGRWRPRVPGRPSKETWEARDRGIRGLHGSQRQQHLSATSQFCPYLIPRTVLPTLKRPLSLVVDPSKPTPALSPLKPAPEPFCRPTVLGCDTRHCWLS